MAAICEDIERIRIRLDDIERRKIETKEKNRLWIEKKKQLNIYELMIELNQKI